MTAARLAGADTAAIAQAVRNFRGRRAPPGICRRDCRRALLQRFQGHQRGRHAQSPRRFSRRAILIILGGKDKGSDYTVLRKPLREKAILALLIGAAAEKIEKQIAGSVAIERAGTLDRAVEIAAHARAARRYGAAGAGLRQLRPV